MFNSDLLDIKSSKTFVSVLITLSVVIFSVVFIMNNYHNLVKVPFTNKFLIPIVALLFFLTLIINGVLFYFIMVKFDIKLQFKELLSLAILNYFGNLITFFKGGSGLRAVYLKTKYKFNYSLSIFVFLFSTLIILFTTFFMFVISIIMLYLKTSNHYFLLLSVYALILAAILFSLVLLFKLFSVYLKKFKIVQYLNSRLVGIKFGWEIVRSDKQIIFIISSLTMVNVLVFTFITSLEYKIISVNISFLQSLFLSSASIFTILTNVTPGAIGIREAVFISTSNVIGISNSSSLFIAVLDRIIQFSILVVFFPIAFYSLFKESRYKGVKEGKLIHRYMALFSKTNVIRICFIFIFLIFIALFFIPPQTLVVDDFESGSLSTWGKSGFETINSTISFLEPRGNVAKITIFTGSTQYTYGSFQKDVNQDWSSFKQGDIVFWIKFSDYYEDIEAISLSFGEKVSGGNQKNKLNYE